ncbi:MAG: 16S rRNA (cytidine(1402)-2'-O)-methyltransferase [Acidimicrobiia bacterium]|nr:16S rRNA (cytidine(1402)-2'-O)-methyltransferase [Acidimicrobiia bacterium]
MTAGKLVVVGTPIGNLGDLAPRAVEVLRTADVVAAEDTRRARALLSAAGVPARGRLVSVHAHNEGERAARLVDRALGGAVVAVVSDAGMPGISDPGAALVQAAAVAGVPVEVVPGPSAVLAALAVSGLPSDRFAFEGFLPRRGRSRDRRLAGIAASDRTVVVFESPRRVPGTLADLARVCGPDRPVAVARELTKLHEEVWRGSAGEAAARAAAGGEPRGEHVIVVAGAAAGDPVGAEALEARVRAELEAGASVRDAARTASAELGVARRTAYDAALRAAAGTAPGAAERDGA